MDKAQKLGKEPVPKLLLNLSLPSIIGMIAVTLYHVADTIFVGRGVGTMAIAAVSVAMPFLMTITIFGQAIGMGGASIISRALGAKDRDKANRTLHSLVHLITLINLLVIVLAFIFLDPLLRLFGADPAFMQLAVDYTSIALIGSFFMNFINVTMNAVRAEGNARFAMHVMIIGAVLNLIVDPIFIFVFEWGIKGAAAATLLSQMTGAILVIIYYLTGKGVLHLKLSEAIKKPDMAIVRESASIGAASFARQSASTLITILLNHSLLAYGGPVAVASFGIVFRLLMFNFMTLFGINQGFMPIAGYNYGAGDMQRVKSVLRVAIRATSIFSVISFAIFFMFNEPLIALFTEDASLLQSSAHALQIIVITLPVIGFQVIGSGLFQALGKVLPALFLGLARQVLFLIPFVIFLPKLYGLEGIWYSFPAADILAAGITAIIIFRQVKRLNSQEVSAEA